jgi:hypothetical protein
MPALLGVGHALAPHQGRPGTPEHLEFWRAQRREVLDTKVETAGAAAGATIVDDFFALRLKS